MVKKLILTLLLIIIPTFCFAGPPSPKEVSDEAYNADTWDGVKNKAPSKNAVRDVIEGLAGGHDSVTLSTDADAILSLVAQEIGVDNQSANTVLAGPAEGVADAPTFRSLVPADIPDISATYQPLDADLTTYAGITPSANVQSLMGAATYAAMRTLLDLEAGTDFYSMTAADTAFESELNNSAGLLAALSDETGTGVAVFGTSPTIATPTITGAITNDAGALTDDTILEADLKAVDASADEDILTRETTTGDFEWHSIAEMLDVAGSLTTGDTYTNTSCAAGADTADELFACFDTTFGTKEDTLSNYAGLVAAIDGQTLARPDADETISGYWTNRIWRLTAATAALGSIATGDIGRDDGTYDPTGATLGVSSYWMKTAAGYSLLWDIAGNTYHGPFQLPYSTSGDATLTEGYIQQKSDEDGVAYHGGSAGEVQSEVFMSFLQHIAITLDPSAAYDQESTYRSFPLFVVGDDFPHGFTVTEWKVKYVAGDPTTELDADLICDVTPDYNTAAGATVMDVLDTTAGASTADSGFDSATCANGGFVYVHFGADPTDANVLIALDIWGYAEED